MLSCLGRFFSQMSQAQVTTLALVLTAVVAAVDRWLVHETFLSVFYLVPIAIAAWHANFRAGLALCLVSSAIMVALDLPMDPGIPSRLASVWNGAAHLAFFCIVAYLLSQQKKHFEEEKTLGRTDYLTGVLNRRAFLEQFQYLLNLATRLRSPITIAYIDVDDFKAINDGHGHDTGDQVLKTVASAIKNFCRRTDLIARLGGDEFAIVFPDTGQEAAQIIIEKIHDAIQTTSSGPVHVSCSVGVVTFVRLPESIEIAIQIADELMYSVKTKGKNATAFSIVDGRS
jgi:diguanylate cyclase (GGDEF)-like protein